MWAGARKLMVRYGLDFWSCSGTISFFNHMNKLHSVTSQKTQIFNIMSVKNLNIVTVKAIRTQLRFYQ
jgi:hypothetical protein